MQTLPAQTLCKYWDSGEEYFAREEYASAVDFYLRSQYQKACRIPSLQRIVQCYRFSKNREEALYYAKLLQSKSKSDSSMVLYGLVLKENGSYTEAKKVFLQLAAKHAGNRRYQLLAASCDSSLTWMRKKAVYATSNLSAINTEYSEISPFLCTNKKLVFASNREGVFIKKKSWYSGEAFYDLYESELSNEAIFGKPKPLSEEINTRHHEFAPSFSPTGDTIYFTKSIDRNAESIDSVNRLKLYASQREVGGAWAASHIFVLNDSLYSFAHPFMEASGRMFFFVSDMKGGYGGSDIYVCFKMDTVWSKPFNLGPVINSPFNESYPFYVDGRLYFSSNKEEGMGGYDLYMASQSGGDWKWVKNLGVPANSCGDDFSLMISSDGKTGYFTSNRDGGKGREDLYKITFSE